MKPKPTAKQSITERKPSLPAEPIFNVRNLGSVRAGRFTQKPFNFFCGPNNTSKTWTMYSLYRWHRLLRVRTKREDIEKDKDFPNLTKFSQIMPKTLPNLFNTSEGKLKDARFELDAHSWQTAPSPENLPGVFLMPAERNGLYLFFRELNAKHTALLHHASKEKNDINESLRDVIRSPYAFPITRAYRKNGKLRDDLGKITSLQLPHRLADDILRDGEVEENDERQTKRIDFRKSKISKPQKRDPHLSAFAQLAFPFSNKERKTDGNVDLSMKDL